MRSALITGTAVLFLMAASAQAQFFTSGAGNGTTEFRATAIADGNLRQLAASGDSSSSAEANGAIGVRFVANRWRLTGTVNIASTADTVLDGFGAVLLQPSTGRALGAGLLDYYCHIRALLPPFLDGLFPSEEAGFLSDTYKARHLFHGWLSASSALWKDADSAQSITVIYWGLGYAWESQVHRDTNSGDFLMLRVEAAFGMRHLFGDADEEYRLAVLGSKRKHFPALELGFVVGVNNVSAGVRAVFIDNPDEGQIQGLTGGHVSAGVALSADVFNIVKES